MEKSFENAVAEYTDQELLEMVYQFNEWEPHLLHAAENELQRRGLLPDDIAARKKTIIDKEDDILSEGKEATFPLQFFGWIGVLGVLGLIIGYNIAFGKTKSKYTDKEYFRYDDASRESGRYMFYISLSVITLFALYKLSTIRSSF